jgi:hypothetical protein
MEISGTSPYPIDAFRLVTNGIDRAEHLLSVDGIVQNDPAMTIAHSTTSNQAEPGHRRALPSIGTVRLHAAVPPYRR